MTTWLKYIIETSRNNHRVTMHKIHEEYIPKLHIHQHSLLTRKVFFRHNFSALVFFSISTGLSRHLKSSESSSHLRLQVIFILRIWIISRSGSSWDNIITGSGSSPNLDQHHWIWIIITGSGSSLDLDHHHWTGSGSSLLDLDHHSIWIITAGSGSSLDLDLSESS